MRIPKATTAAALLSASVLMVGCVAYPLPDGNYVYQPAPVYYAPPPVAYYPPPAYYPAPAYYAAPSVSLAFGTGWGGRRHHHRHHHR